MTMTEMAEADAYLLVFLLRFSIVLRHQIRTMLNITDSSCKTKQTQSKLKMFMIIHIV